jgi:protein TonB
MNILIFIIVAVLIVSIYDFATSRSWQQVTSSSRNEVVFGERNKTYGAYQIRKEYDRNLIFILLGVISTIGISYGTYSYFKSRPFEEITMSVPEQLIVPFIIPADNITPPPTSTKQETLAKTEKFIDPIVTDNPLDRSTIPTQEILVDVNTGTNTSEGNGSEFSTSSGTGIGTGTETGNETVSEAPAIDPFPDTDALFPGGISAMMSFLNKNIKYPDNAVQDGIEGRAFLRFVVEKDGSIGSVSVQTSVPNCPECDREAVRVIKMMPKWTPGKSAGKIVRSYYTMPIIFKLK